MIVVKWHGHQVLPVTLGSCVTCLCVMLPSSEARIQLGLEEPSQFEPRTAVRSRHTASQV